MSQYNSLEHSITNLKTQEPLVNLRSVESQNIPYVIK